MMRSTDFIDIITCTLGSRHGEMSRSLVWEVVVFEVLFSNLPCPGGAVGKPTWWW